MNETNNGKQSFTPFSPSELVEYGSIDEITQLLSSGGKVSTKDGLGYS
jgi:hypothetical protein